MNDVVLLIERFMASDATAEEQEQLDQLLATDPRAAELLASHARLDALLRSHFRVERRVDEASLAELVRDGAPGTTGTTRSTAARQGRRWLVPATPLSVAVACAALAVAAVVWLWLREAPREPGADSEPVFAVVRETLRGRWTDGREVRVSESVGKGRWGLESGLVSLSAADGVEMLVEGPAIGEWLGARHVRLASGTVVVRMPKGGSGFVVEMAQMRVTDLGTEFGVSVSPSGDERVQVYGGRVRAEAAASGEVRELKAGSALRCSAKGELAPAAFVEDQFIRRMPRPTPGNPGGPVHNRSVIESVAVMRATNPVSVDGRLTEWNRGTFFKSACEPPYAATYFVEGGMMYDAAHLYVAAHVGDPEPMRNASRDGLQFAGGSVIVRLSSDRRLGWPLKGISRPFRPQQPSRELLADSTNERVTSLILWYDAKSGRASLDLQHSFDFLRPAVAPAGWQGAFRKDADGLGYTLEYAIPWRLLHCESDPPRAGDVMAALWTVHWSDADGRICFGQLIDVTNRNPPASPTPSPASFFLSGPHWGRAVFRSEAAPE